MRNERPPLDRKAADAKIEVLSNGEVEPPEPPMSRSPTPDIVNDPVTRKKCLEDLDRAERVAYEDIILV